MKMRFERANDEVVYCFSDSGPRDAELGFLGKEPGEDGYWRFYPNGWGGPMTCKDCREVAKKLSDLNMAGSEG